MTKSWWDTVDLIAGKQIGYHLRQHPQLIDPSVGKWLNSGNLWLQRTALLFQLKYKQNTDTALLLKVIDRLKDSDEFFLQKAIGWILREYSKTDAAWVCKVVDQKELAPLSAREALKWLKNNANGR